jgi:hypothetical protein
MPSNDPHAMAAMASPVVLRHWLSLARRDAFAPTSSAAVGCLGLIGLGSSHARRLHRAPPLAIPCPCGSAMPMPLPPPSEAAHSPSTCVTFWPLLRFLSRQPGSLRSATQRIPTGRAAGICRLPPLACATADSSPRLRLRGRLAPPCPRRRDRARPRSSTAPDFCAPHRASRLW